MLKQAGWTAKTTTTMSHHYAGNLCKYRPTQYSPKKSEKKKVIEVHFMSEKGLQQ